MDSGKALVNGIRIHYLSAGQGPNLVMIHGLATNLAFWYPRILPLLVKRYRVTVYDLRGHGKSDMPPNGYTSADMACDLAGLLGHLGISQFHLVGHSFGGAVALHYTTINPARVSSLALIDCRVHELQPFPSYKDSAFWKSRRKKLRERGITVAADMPKVFYTTLEELGSSVGVMVPGGWSTDSRLVEHWLRLRSTTTIGEDVRKTSGLTVGRMRQIRQPTLLVFGEQSRCLKTCRRLQAVLCNVETKIIPGSGHLLPLQKPFELVRELTEFLAKVDSGDNISW